METWDQMRLQYYVFIIFSRPIHFMVIRDIEKNVCSCMRRRRRQENVAALRAASVTFVDCLCSDLAKWRTCIEGETEWFVSRCWLLRDYLRVLVIYSSLSNIHGFVVVEILRSEEQHVLKVTQNDFKWMLIISASDQNLDFNIPCNLFFFYTEENERGRSIE